MEETLGKRISANRKRLGMTQDRLAELLGVTAQAVSKWENDQSCPDITMLPKLAEIFGISTDELLGLAAPRQEPVFEAEVVEPQKDHFEFRWDNGRRGLLGCAVWVLLAGAMLLAGNLLPFDFGFWETLWHTGLLTVGVFGLYPHFSVFRLTCTLEGGYLVADDFCLLPFTLGKGLILPVLLLFLGLHLLTEAFKKSKTASIHVTKNGKNIKKGTCTMLGNHFDCDNSFGETTHRIQADRLEGGNADNSFGALTVDLRDCRDFAPDCHVNLNCSFGELNLIVPRCCAVRPQNSTAFASVTTKGQPDPDARYFLTADCDVSFGQITIQYL